MEPLILYFVLFFPRVFSIISSGGISQEIELPETIQFSMVRELGRTLTYTIPSLALIWYIILNKKSLSSLKQERPGKQDILPFAIGLPGLIFIGMGISFVILLFSRYEGFIPPLRVEAPGTILGWVVMVFSCLGTGYLEESYFRYYLLTKLESQLPPVGLRIVFSTILFSLCHIYEGPWGIINAVLAGLLLSVLFIRYKSLHGIAWAHGAYNIFVYFMGNFGS